MGGQLRAPERGIWMLQRAGISSGSVQLLLMCLRAKVDDLLPRYGPLAGELIAGLQGSPHRQEGCRRGCCS
jgi:hypothetical protein